jgi:hypothetical protein
MVKTQIRLIFEFYAKQKELALLTTLNIQPDKIKVNIIDMTFTKKDDKYLHVFAIIGETSINSKELQKSNDAQIKQFKKNLTKLNIVYKIHKSVMIYDLGNVSDTPGVYRQFISLLQCNNIKINFSISSSGSNISSNDTTLYFIVKQIEKTVNIINNFDWKNPDKMLCINYNNIKKLVNDY